MEEEITYERAKEINSAMLDFGLRAMNYKTKPARKLLANVSLLEMLSCQKIIRDHEGECELGGEAKTFSMVCDDRLVAAVYATVNFDPDSSHIIAIDENFQAALVVAEIDDETREQLMEQGE